MTNVVVIHTDDTGRYIGPYGLDVENPHLSALADDGLLFRNAFCTAPQCSPSRGSLATGQHPHSNGLIGLAHHEGVEMDDYGRHLVRYLGEHGFETVLAGEQHEAGLDGNRHEAASEVIGYDRVLEPEASATEALPFEHNRSRRDYPNVAAAERYIRGDPEEPYFLSVGLWNIKNAAGVPLDETAIDPDRVSVPGPLPDVPAVREEWAGHQALTRVVDRCVGVVVEALRETGQLEETVVVFTTDHGPQLPFMKCDLFDDGIGIALIARFPEGPAGETADGLVSNVDVFPTLCEYLDLPVPAYVEGESLLPIVEGETDTVRDAVFAGLTFHGEYEPKRCVRTDRYKYIRRFDDTPRELVNVDDTESKRFLAEHDLGERTRPREALYDCYHDPAERTNLVEDPAYREVHSRLAQRLEEWMEHTDDPLLSPPVPDPRGE